MKFGAALLVLATTALAQNIRRGDYGEEDYGNGGDEYGSGGEEYGDGGDDGYGDNGGDNGGDYGGDDGGDDDGDGDEGGGGHETAPVRARVRDEVEEGHGHRLGAVVGEVATQLQAMQADPEQAAVAGEALRLLLRFQREGAAAGGAQ